MNEKPKYTVVTVRGQSYAFAESDRLGGGYTGVAYVAYPYDPKTQTLDKRDEKKVVVKAMKRGEVSQATFQSEAEFLEKKRFGLKGSYIDEKKGLYYIVMEFAGAALNPNELAKEVNFSFSETVKTAWMIALELNRLHHKTLYEKGVAEALVHSDIWPVNIFVKVEGKEVKDVRIGDFGIASIIENDEEPKRDIVALGNIFVALFQPVMEDVPQKILFDEIMRNLLYKIIGEMRSKEGKKPDADEVLRFFTVLNQYARAKTDEQKKQCLIALADDEDVIPKFVASSGSEETVNEYLAQKTSHAEQATIASKILLEAFRHNRGSLAAIATICFDFGADINAQSDDGNTVLHLVCGAKNPDVGMIKLFLGKGALVDVENNAGETPLDYVCTRGNAEIMKLMLEKRSKVVDDKDDAQLNRLLWIAVYQKHGELVKVLLDHGADINAKDDKNNTALHLACEEMNPDVGIIKLLLEKGAQVDFRNADGKTPLDYARANGNAEIVNLILKHSEVVKDKTKLEQMLFLAADTGHTKLAEMLLGHDVDVNVKNRDGNTVLHIACARGLDVSIIKLLLEKGAQGDVQNSEGKTPLDYACIRGNVEVVKLMLDVKDKAKLEQVFRLAAEVGHVHIVEMLLGLGVDINHRGDNGGTVIHKLCESVPKINIIELLLKKGADINAKDGDGNTALHLACKNTLGVGFVKLLLEKGARPDVQNSEGRTPLDCAVATLDRAHTLESRKIIKLFEFLKKIEKIENPTVINQLLSNYKGLLEQIEQKIEVDDGSLSPQNIKPFVDRLNLAVPEEEYSDKRYDTYDLGQHNLSQVFNLDEEFYQENVIEKKVKESVSPTEGHPQAKAQDESKPKEESIPKEELRSARGRQPGM